MRNPEINNVRFEISRGRSTQNGSKEKKDDRVPYKKGENRKREQLPPRKGRRREDK